MNKEIKEKLDQFINKHIVAIGIIFAILLVPMTMGLRELKIAMGFPDQDLWLANKNSLLPDELIDKNDLNANWKFSSISTSQSDETGDEKLIEDAYRIFMAKYKNQDIVLSQHIYSYKNSLIIIDERKTAWDTWFYRMEDHSTIEMLQNFYNPVLDIQTYCYNQHNLNRNHSETECMMYQIEGQNLIRMKIGFTDITDKSIYMEIIAELERLME
jgi:hypothetical protein